MPSRLGAVELSQPTIQADRKKRDDDAVQGVVQRLTRGDLRSSRISVRPSLLPFAHRPVMPYAAVVSGSFGRTDWARKCLMQLRQHERISDSIRRMQAVARSFFR